MVELQHRPITNKMRDKYDCSCCMYALNMDGTSANKYERKAKYCALPHCMQTHGYTSVQLKEYERLIYGELNG